MSLRVGKRSKWSRICDDYNTAYWDWYYSKDNAIAAADVEIALLQDALDAADRTAAELEQPQYGCEYMANKRLCVDYFIAQCLIAGVMHGDCRGFDSTAKISQSRLQIYINPETRDLEVLFNSTKVASLYCPAGAGTCVPTVFTFESMEDVVSLSDITVEDREGGGFLLRVRNVKTPACQISMYLICPQIDTDLEFIPNSGLEGGFDVRWEGNRSPSVGVYNYSGGYYRTMKEIPQKSRSAWRFIKNLIDIFTWERELAPPENPNQCSLY